MIDLIFQFGSEVILVHIDGTNIQFGNAGQGNKLATLEGLKLSYSGVVREFPDLETDPEWKHKALIRFKEKISKYKNENEIAEYLIEDLRKFGYKPKMKQRSGFRPERLT